MKHLCSLAAIGVMGLVGAALLMAAAKPASSVTVQHDEKTGRVEVSEGGTAVLRYNFDTVPV